MTIFVPYTVRGAYQGSLASFHRIVVTETHGGNTLLVLAACDMWDGFDGTSLTHGSIVGGAPSDGTLLSYQPYGKEGLLVVDIDISAATGLLAARCKAC